MIKKRHRSEPYNPKIAAAFFKAGFVEAWGRGIEKVITNSKKYNGIVPTFEYTCGINVEFKSRFPKINFKNGKRVGNRVGNNITENQNKILHLISENPKLSAQKISCEIGTSKRKIEENISKLKNANILKRVGGTRGYWEITG